MNDPSATMPAVRADAISQFAKDAIDFVIDQEGGWKLTVVPGEYDWTYAGITEAVFWKHIKGEDTLNISIYGMDSMQNWITGDTKRAHDTVYEIYYNEYFQPIMGKFSECNIPDKKLFLSCAVNCGVETCIKILQQTLKLRVDGVLGPETATVYSEIFHIGYYYKFLVNWLAHYNEIVAPNPQKLQYLRGWTNRVLAFLS